MCALHVSAQENTEKESQRRKNTIQGARKTEKRTDTHCRKRKEKTDGRV